MLLYKGIVFLLEFKVGETIYPRNAIDQVTDYALDLTCFHHKSHNKLIVPILISTEAKNKDFDFSILKDRIMYPNCCNAFNIKECISLVC